MAYGSPVQRVAELILEAVRAQPEAKTDPAPSVVFEDFGDNALIFDAYFWCDVGGESCCAISAAISGFASPSCLTRAVLSSHSRSAMCISIPWTRWKCDSSIRMPAPAKLLTAIAHAACAKRHHPCMMRSVA